MLYIPQRIIAQSLTGNVVAMYQCAIVSHLSPHLIFPPFSRVTRLKEAPCVLTMQLVHVQTVERLHHQCCDCCVFVNHCITGLSTGLCCCILTVVRLYLDCYVTNLDY